MIFTGVAGPFFFFWSLHGGIAGSSQITTEILFSVDPRNERLSFTIQHHIASYLGLFNIESPHFSGLSIFKARNKQREKSFVMGWLVQF
jgi:hypothetical protein